MTDWLAGMQQTFEYYTVDPITWRDVSRIPNIKTSTVNRDMQVETLGSATIDTTEMLGETYVRIYLVTVQNGIKERHPLATVLVQTPSSNYDGLIRSVSMDAYTPLLELKEKYPPLGYFAPKGTNVLDFAYERTRENLRAPVIKPDCEETLYDDFVAETGEGWLSYNTSLINYAKFSYGLDPLGQVLFVPNRDIDAMTPIWTYNDDNSSILHSSVSMEHDLFGIPNVVEVIYSSGGSNFYSRVENRDPNSPTSIQNRGREIPHRVTNLNMVGTPTQAMIDEYATQLLKEKSSVAYTVTFTHGYCPVTIGDCVRLNYTRAGITDIKGKVISQSIKCEPGCPVTEKVVYLAKLWG